jgi:Flp pilus assembly protein CpaB
MSRRSPRAVALWLAAVVVAVATAALVATDLAALHGRAHSLGATRSVAVAARDLPLGTTIRRGDITTRSVHRSQLPAGALSPNAAQRRVVAVPVVRGAFVVDGNVAPRRRTGLDGAIPPGMRALRIVARDALRPPVGSSVDVLVTFESRDETAAGGAPTVVAARGVLVLGTDDEPAAIESGTAGTAGTGRDTGGQSGGVGVTLLVTEDDAPRLAFAVAAGVVTLALVPPEDAGSMAAR